MHYVSLIRIFNFSKISESDGNSTPFYFGTTDLKCMQLMNLKRRIFGRATLARPQLPERQFWHLTHRWIYYDGWYFELFHKPRTRFPVKSKWCSFEREANPAGYSKLPVSCIRKCTMYYIDRYRPSYLTFTHNCHHFANKIAEVLCQYSECPDWCSESERIRIAIINATIT